jgi:hypothetical protein
MNDSVNQGVTPIEGDFWDIIIDIVPIIFLIIIVYFVVRLYIKMSRYLDRKNKQD